MLLDTAHIQEKDIEFLNKRRHYRNEAAIEPLFQPVPYYKPKLLTAPELRVL